MKNVTFLGHVPFKVQILGAMIRIVDLTPWIYFTDVC